MKPLLVLIALVCGLAARPDGHVIVAEIAQSRLTPAARAAVRVPADNRIGQAYYTQAIQVVDGQLAAAGIRLAGILNGVLR